MSLGGTASYEGVDDLPPLVEAAVELARSYSFEQSCRPEHGRLLRVLAGGVEVGGAIGETGAGCGVGLAWLASGARPGVRLVSVEAAEGRAAMAADLFADVDAVTVVHGDWTSLEGHGPFDLLALDGGGQGKGDGDAFNPASWLRPGATFVIDDLTPATTWPPTFEGEVDQVRTRWFDHSGVAATELRLRPDVSTLVGLWHRTLPTPGW